MCCNYGEPEDQVDMVCPGCDVINPECEWMDFGIGAYEYWGATGVDVQECWVTKCCEAEPVELRPEPVDSPTEEWEVV